MMEQQMYQQEQIGNNQMAQQQMMLCPVRVLYDNPMLMQPDEPVQQNQTIYFNQQAQPPWLRPVQNQIIYVQHIPNNVVPMQQTMDPNQLYVQQNYVSYPQLMPQQILTHNPQDQIRYQTQVPNVVQNNPNVVVQNIQPNSTIQNVDTRNYTIQANTNASNAMANHFIMANNGQIQNNIHTTPRNVSHTVTSETLTQNMSQSAGMVGSKPAETVQTPGVYKNIAPQPNHQYIMIRPQVANQVQNAQNIQNVQHIGQTFVPNIRPNMPVFTQNVTSAPQNVQQSVNLRPNIQGYLQTPIVPNIQVSKADNDGATVSYTAVRNGQTYTYRALQPRPQQRNMPNLLPMNELLKQNELLMPKQNIQNTNSAVPNLNTNVNATNVTTFSQIKTEQNEVTLNRKRKSESPDETEKKRPTNSAVFGNITVTAKPQGNISRNVSTFSDVGVNTVPVSKVQNKPLRARPNPILPAVNQTTMERIEHIIKQELNMAEQSSKQNNKMRSSIVAFNTPPQNIENKTIVSQAPVFNINPVAPTENIKIKHEPIRKVTEIVPQSDISQVASIDNKMVISQGPVPYISPMSSVQIIIKQEHKVRDIGKVQQTDSLKSTSKSNETKEEAKQVEKDKLIRNTVFTQARGRMFNDKTVLNNVNTEQNITKLEQTSVASVSPKQDNAVQTNLISKDTKTNASIGKSSTEKLDKNKHGNSSAINTTSNGGFQETIKTDISTNNEKLKTKYEVSFKDTTNDVSENVTKTDNSNLKLNAETIKTQTVKSSSTGKSIDGASKETIKTDINNVEKVTAEELHKADETPTNSTSEANVTKKVPTDSEPVAKDKIGYKHLSINDMKGKEIHIVDGSIVREDRNHILTHVLDGFVIQESSVPFAIRKPLIERIIYTNSPIIPEENMDEIFGTAKEDVARTEENDEATKENINIMEISNLNITEENSETEEVNENNSRASGGDPFEGVKPDVVRSWTAEELVLHLSKFQWSNTVSVLQEHEIDGESLFLASKEQLETIGVNATHADAICEFVLKC